MKIGICGQHLATINRSRELFRTMIKAGHQIVPYNSQDVDILIAGALPPQEHTRPYVQMIMGYDGPLFLSSLDDGTKFKTDNLPEALLDRCRGFIQMFWASDWNRNRQIIINPFIRQIPITPLLSKKPQICFYGLATGPVKNNIRIETCRILKKYPWFKGGIVGNPPGAQPRDWADVAIQSLPHNKFLQATNESRGTLALPGYNPLTYRFFEALATKSVAITYGLDEWDKTGNRNDFRWLNLLEPGVHYVAIKPDLSDLVAQCEQILSDNRYATSIAEAGYKRYCHYYHLNPDGTLSNTMWKDIKTQFTSLGINL